MILTIDIGIRNLSMCAMSCDDKTDMASYKIHLWDVYNTLDNGDSNNICDQSQKNGKVCGKKACIKNDCEGGVIYTCKTHSNKSVKCTVIKTKKVNDYLLQDIAKIVLSKIDDIYTSNKDIFDNLTKISIELQPKVNQKMKFTSHIIYGKLVEIMKETRCEIRFVRASQKLKAYTGPEIKCTVKNAYQRRKYLSIEYTKWFLENKFNKEERERWIPILENHSKKDDVADTYLMAINVLYGIPKKQTRQKNGKCIK